MIFPIKIFEKLNLSNIMPILLSRRTLRFDKLFPSLYKGYIIKVWEICEGESKRVFNNQAVYSPYSGAHKGMQRANFQQKILCYNFFCILSTIV